MFKSTQKAHCIGTPKDLSKTQSTLRPNHEGTNILNIAYVITTPFSKTHQQHQELKARKHSQHHDAWCCASRFQSGPFVPSGIFFFSLRSSSQGPPMCGRFGMDVISSHLHLYVSSFPFLTRLESLGWGTFASHVCKHAVSICLLLLPLPLDGMLMLVLMQTHCNLQLQVQGRTYASADYGNVLEDSPRLHDVF